MSRLESKFLNMSSAILYDMSKKLDFNEKSLSILILNLFLDKKECA